MSKRRTQLLGVLTMLLATVAVHELASADSSYGNSRWPSSLTNGVLKVQGAGYGSWGRGWVTVDTNVAAYKEVGTSKGPVIVYVKKTKQWRILQLDFASGQQNNARTFSKPIEILRHGRYGALIRVDGTCYDHSWGGLRRVGCGEVKGRFM